MPNPGVPVAPGAYKMRRDAAVKAVNAVDPAVKAKIKQYYPTGSQPGHAVTSVNPKTGRPN